jgi:methyltransferase-like protein 6
MSASQPCSAAPAALEAAAPPRRVAYFDADFVHDEAAAIRDLPAAAASPLDAAAEEAAASSARCWQRFFARHRAGFFHARSFVLEAFPALEGLVGAGGRLLEVGAGSGSNVAGLLERLPGMRAVYACDVAPAALRAVRGHPRVQEEERNGRLRLFLWDVATGACPVSPPGLRVGGRGGGCGGGGGGGGGSGGISEGGSGSDSGGSRAAELNALHATFLPTPPEVAAGGQLDAALLTFVASALHPRDHARAFSNAAATLRPGGRLFFRDYGVGDVAATRLEPLGARLYRRGDGTLSYAFALEEVRLHMEAAGLVNIELKHACVANRNRRTGVELRRVFVSGSGARRG